MSKIVKFQRIPVAVEARWFGNEEDGQIIEKWVKEGGEWACTWFPHKEAVPNVSKRETHHIVLDTPVGEMQLEPGVWVLRESGGQFWPFTPEDLDKRYEAYKPETGVIEGSVVHHPES